MDDTERQFREADAAVDKAVADFISEIESMSGRWDAVAPAYILESVLLALCEEMTRLIDDPDLANVMGEAMLKLSDALGDYRGSRGEEDPLSHRATKSTHALFLSDQGGWTPEQKTPLHVASLPTPSRKWSGFHPHR